MIEEKRPTECPDCNGSMGKRGRTYTAFEDFLKEPTLPIMRETCKSCADKRFEEDQQRLK